MPLYKNTFQPFFPDPDSPIPVDCADRFCNLVASGDAPGQEWIQTPCSGNLIDDPQFENVSLGPELVLNGSFTGSAANWTLNGNWVYGTNNIAYLGGPGILALQTGLGLVAGTVYQVTIDFSGTVTGSFCVNLGAGAGRTSSNPITETGSYTFVLAYNDTDDEISIEPLSAGFNGAVIDNVSVKVLTTTDWETSGIWALSNGSACKTEVGGGLLYNLSPDYFETGDYYVVTVEVDGYGGTGDLTLYIDDGTGSTATNAQTPITANGQKTYYITALQDGVIGFSPTADFTGCVSKPTVRRLRTDYNFQLINAAGDSVDISASATYIEDRILLIVDFAELLATGIIEDYGCYTIAVTDACLVSGDNLLTDGDFDNQNFDEWGGGVTYPYQFNFDGTGLEFIFEPLEGPTLISNGDFSGGTTGWTGFGADWTEAGAATHVPGNTTPLTQGVTFMAMPPFPIGLFAWFTLDVSGRTAGSFTVSLDGQTTAPFTANDTIVLGFTLSTGGAHTFSINPTSNFDGTIDNIALHETNNPWLNFPAIYHNPTAALQNGNYNIDWTTVSNLVDGQTGIIVSLDFGIPFGTYGSLASGANSQTINNYTPTGKILFLAAKFTTSGGYYKVGRIKIDDVSLYAVEPFEATYTSECFDFQVTWPGTTLVTGWCDQDSLGSIYTDVLGVEYNDNLGFVTTGYRLQMRLELRSDFPTIPTLGNNAFFGDGSAAVKYAQFEKYWQLSTDWISEAAHTALAGLIHCDHFTIGDTGEMATEYIAEMEEYTPQWRGEGDSNLATITLNIRKKIGGMKFMRHL